MKAENRWKYKTETKFVNWIDDGSSDVSLTRRGIRVVSTFGFYNFGLADGCC